MRLRITGGVIAPATAQAIATCADEYGNGIIELSSRGNLQLRGVSERTLRGLQEKLRALALIDKEPNAESVRNIMASPLAGLGFSAAADIRADVGTLDARLRGDPTLHALPGKFLFLIDDGSSLPLPCEKADIGFAAHLNNGKAFYAVTLGGQFAGACAIGDMVETAVCLARSFLRWRRNDEHRMAALVERVGVGPFIEAANLSPLPDMEERAGASHILGLHVSDRCEALAIGIPFGQLDCAALRFLATEAATVDGELRLSSWRALFIAAKKLPEDLASRLRVAGFILDDEAEIRAIAACSGKPACLRGEVLTRRDAARLAPLARRLAANGVALHVSGCAKGCAHQGSVPVTLVGRDGYYDLIIDGRADSRPCARGLSLCEVEALLEKLARTDVAERKGLARRFLAEMHR